jgi:hypothetical protein
MTLKMTDVAGKVKASLKMVPGIRFAFLYGPGAKKDQQGDMDVMVIGGQGPEEMEEMISKVEEEVGNRIQITSYTLREFQLRIRAKDNLIWDALRGPKVMLIGDEKEMMEEARQGSGSF